jgi:ribonuclease PH
VFSQADGSAYIEQGNTKCLAAVYGPREVSGFKTVDSFYYSCFCFVF